jgi:hypothetical protein
MICVRQQVCVRHMQSALLAVPWWSASLALVPHVEVCLSPNASHGSLMKGVVYAASDSKSATYPLEPDLHFSEQLVNGTTAASASRIGIVVIVNAFNHPNTNHRHHAAQQHLH